MSNLSKNELRVRYRDLRKAMSVQVQKEAASQVCLRIQDMEKYRESSHIALYQAINQEIDLDLLWQIASKQGRNCYFPALVEDKKLAFLPATPDTSFRKNRYNILEPDLDLSQAIPIEDLQIMFLPLLVFDQNCTRIGMGSGYYDRSLDHKKRPFLIGIAYELQRHPWIEPDPWDVPLDAVVTEKTIYWRGTE